MLKVVSTSQIREIDRCAIGRYGIPELILMENAGIQSLLFLEECLGTLEGKRIGIFCGKGNNGGDGAVLARQLFTRRFDPVLYLLASRNELAGSTKVNMDAYAAMGGRIEEVRSEADLKKHRSAIRHAGALVDAIVGTGLKSGLKGLYRAAVETINECKRYCLALDIPTGIHSDHGAVFDLAVTADATITFGLPKTGLLFYPAAKFVGRLKTAGIGFPPPLLAASPCEAYLLDGGWVGARLPVRRADHHKGNYGHAVVSGGSDGMGGAVALASLAALKVGAGLSTAVVTKQLGRQFETGVPEVMSHSLSEDLAEPANTGRIARFANERSVLLLGPGMGRDERFVSMVAELVTSVTVPIIIDADGLNNLAPRKEILKKRRTPVIITPHPGEMASLTGSSAEEINAGRLAAAKSFSAEFNCITVLKGARTVVAAPDGTAYINLTGNANLASGGTGDVLGGMIAGYVAQGLSPLDACAVAVYLHGLAADIYTEARDAWSLTASALIGYIPHALSRVTGTKTGI